MRKLLPLAQTNALLVLSHDASSETSTAHNEQLYVTCTLVHKVSNVDVNDTLVVRSSSSRPR